MNNDPDYLIFRISYATIEKKVRGAAMLYLSKSKYCGLDTYAMVKVWEELNRVVEEKEE